MPVLDPNALIQDRVTAIRDLHETTGIGRAQLDVSGGVDSAVMLGLISQAIGPEAIIAAHSRIDSSDSALEQAEEVAQAFGVRLAVIDLTELFHRLADDIRASMVAAGHPAEEIDTRLESDPMVLGSLRSTLRAPVGRGFNRFGGGGIRHGTGNECEDRWLRFYQKGGDGEVDTNPIAMLAKAEVYQLGKALGVPDSILTATPTPDLWGIGDKHSDEDEIASFVGVESGEHSYYGTIDAAGAYRRAGLIERVSRFDDEVNGRFLAPDRRSDSPGDQESASPWVETALGSTALGGLNEELVSRLLPGVKRVERITRHKFNPAIPTLGDRSELLERGILTDELPDPNA